MQVDRRQAQGSCRHGGHHQEEIDPSLEVRERVELRLEGDRQQETGQDLGAGLGDSQLLQDVAPVAIHLFVERLVAAVGRVSIIGRITLDGRWITLE